jgi:hypothetical protein
MQLLLNRTFLLLKTYALKYKFNNIFALPHACSLLISTARLSFIKQILLSALKYKFYVYDILHS